MQMTQEDLAALHAGTLPDQAVWKFRRDNGQIFESQRLIAAELLVRDDLGLLKPGARADIIAMPGNPLDDITAIGRVDFVMGSGTVHRRPDERHDYPA